jgi:hypothetical protein
VARPFIRSLEDTRVLSDGATARQLSPRGAREREREATVSGVPSMETGRQRGGSGVELDGNGYRVPKRGIGGGIDSSGGRGSWGCLL